MTGTDIPNPNILVLGDDPKAVRKVRLIGLALFNAGAVLSIVFLRNVYDDPARYSWFLIAAFVLVALAFMAGALVMILNSTHRTTFDRGSGLITIDRSSFMGQQAYQGSLGAIKAVGLQHQIGLRGMRIVRPVLYMHDGTEVGIVGTANQDTVVTATVAEIAAFLDKPVMPPRGQ
jgi:hypothetical protein